MCQCGASFHVCEQGIRASVRLDVAVTRVEPAPYISSLDLMAVGMVMGEMEIIVTTMVTTVVIW